MGGPALAVEWFAGDREALRPLFELAEDSAVQLDRYLTEGRVLVARMGPAIVGHLQLVDDGPDGHVQLKNMAVRADHQRRGIGGQLVRTAFRLLAAEGAMTVQVATAAADTGNLRFSSARASGSGRSSATRSPWRPGTRPVAKSTALPSETACGSTSTCPFRPRRKTSAGL